MMAFTCKETTQLFTTRSSLGSSKNSTNRFCFGVLVFVLLLTIHIFLLPKSDKAYTPHRTAAWSDNAQGTELS